MATVEEPVTGMPVELDPVAGNEGGVAEDEDLVSSYADHLDGDEEVPGAEGEEGKQEQERPEEAPKQEGEKGEQEQEVARPTAVGADTMGETLFLGAKDAPEKGADEAAKAEALDAPTPAALEEPLPVQPEEEVVDAAVDAIAGVESEPDPASVPAPVTEKEEVPATPASAALAVTADASAPSLPVSQDAQEALGGSTEVRKPSIPQVHRKSLGLPPATVGEGSGIAKAAITEAVRATNPILEGLMSAIERAAANDPELKVISFKDINVFKPAHGIALASALEGNTHLETLQLENCQLSTTAAIELARAITKNTRCALRLLNLEANHFQPPGMKAIAEMLEANESITELRVSRQKYPTGTDAEQSFARSLEKKNHT